MRSFAWVLGFIGGGLVLAFLINAALVDSITTPWAVTGGVGALLFAGWLFADRESLGAAASSRGARFTSTALVLSLLGLGLAVASNVLANRYDKRWDLTSTGRFTLSDQTDSILKGLDREVKVVAFFSLESMGEKEQFEDLIEGYSQKSTLLKVEYHDPVSEPLVAQQYKITTPYGTVILEAGDRTQRLESDFGEEAVTNALVRLTSDKDHVVCFTTGHGELPVDQDNDPSSLSGAVVKLEGLNYTVKNVTLLRDGGVPADCEMLIAADAQVDWLPAEREMLAAYVAGGGSFVLLIEPLQAPGLAADMARYGIAVGNDVVLEQNPNYQLVGGDMSYLVLDPSSFDLHPISEPIKGMTLLRLARSVDRGAEVPGINVAVLAHTSAYAWAETTLDQNTLPSPDEGQDRIGQIPLIAVAEITDPAAIPVGNRAVGEVGGASPLSGLLGGAAAAATPSEATPSDAAPAEAAPADVARKAGGKVVVFGDADFASNELIDQGSNRDLLLNTVAWLAGEEDQVSIRSPEGAKGSLSLNLGQGLLMWLVCLLGAPGVAVGMAVSTWISRRAR